VITDARPHAGTRSWQARLPLFYGWIIVGLGFSTAFFSIGLTWAAGLFAVPMQQELGWSRSAFFCAVRRAHVRRCRPRRADVLWLWAR
jgi:hypothetical protein